MYTNYILYKIVSVWHFCQANILPITSLYSCYNPILRGNKFKFLIPITVFILLRTLWFLHLKYYKKTMVIRCLWWKMSSKKMICNYKHLHGTLETLFYKCIPILLTCISTVSHLCTWYFEKFDSHSNYCMQLLSCVSLKHWKGGLINP